MQIAAWFTVFLDIEKKHSHRDSFDDYFIFGQQPIRRRRDYRHSIFDQTRL